MLKLNTMPLMEYSASFAIDSTICRTRTNEKIASWAGAFGMTNIMSAIIRMTARSRPK